MSSVGGNETVVFELSLAPAREKVRKLGHKLSTRTITKWWHYLTVGGTVEAATLKAAGYDTWTRFAPTLQRLVEEKLNGMLKETTLSIKIRADSPQRAHELISLFEPAMALFGRSNSNFLVPADKQTYPLVLSPSEFAAMWHLPSSQCQVPGIQWESAVSAPAPTALLRENKGVFIGTNRFQGRSRDIWLPYEDRVTHINVVGKTGVGKSTFLHTLIHQDIMAGRGVAVIDPHGDLVNRVIALSVPEEREKDVVVFDMSDIDYPVGLNFFYAPEGVRRDTIASQTLAVVRKMFAESWSSTRMEDAMYAALMALQYVEGATIRDVTRLFNDSGFRSEVLARVKDPVVLEFWFDEYESLSAAYQREVARPITNRIRKFYRNRRIGRVVGQSSSLDFRKIIDTRKIFLAKLTGISEIEAETLGALLISKFQLAAMSRTNLSPQKRLPYYLYVDEVQNLSATSLPVLFSGARKTGLSLVVANQFLRQLEGATLESIMGNVGTSVIFRVGPRDATTLAPFIRPELSKDALVNLDRFSAIVKMQVGGSTQPAFSIQSPEPIPIDRGARERYLRVRAFSRQKYARPKEEVDAEFLARYQQTQQPDSSQNSEAEANYFG
jgi:hypothetical protein